MVQKMFPVPVKVRRNKNYRVPFFPCVKKIQLGKIKRMILLNEINYLRRDTNELKKKSKGIKQDYDRLHRLSTNQVPVPQGCILALIAFSLRN